MKFFYKYCFFIVLLSFSLNLKAEFLTLDSHIDIPFDYMTNPKHDPGNLTEMQVDFSKMKLGGLDSGFFIVYVEQSELTNSGYQNAQDLAKLKFNAIRKMTEKYSDKIILALNPGDIRRAKEEGKMSAAIGIENGYIIGNDITSLKVFMI